MIRQLIRFGIVGVIATIVDFGVLVGLKELLHVDILLAAAIAFCVSVIVNYILSMTFVFKSKKQSKIKEFVLFFVLSAGGLVLNEIILWAGVTFTAWHYLFIKILATALVLIYNFITRKLCLEGK